MNAFWVWFRDQSLDFGGDPITPSPILPQLSPPVMDLNEKAIFQQPSPGGSTVMQGN